MLLPVSHIEIRVWLRERHWRRDDRKWNDDRLNMLGVTGHVNEHDIDHESEGDGMQERCLRDERES